MLKFRCQHCGQRIAVGARHLGKLVTCPECGEPTHPLAEQIVSLQHASGLMVKNPRGCADDRPFQSLAGLRPKEPQHCANCGQGFGRLQQRASWMGHSVCPNCHARLLGEYAVVEDAASRGLSGEVPGSSRIKPKPTIHSRQPAQKVNVRARRVPESSGVGDPSRFLARSAQVAGRLALLVGIGTVGKARSIPRLSDDSDAKSSLVVVDRPDAKLPGPSLNGRLFAALVIITLAGVAVYGALTLLQALAGYLTAAAFILVAVVGGYLLLRVSLSASRRLWPIRTGVRAPQPSTAQKGA